MNRKRLLKLVAALCVGLVCCAVISAKPDPKKQVFNGAQLPVLLLEGRMWQCVDRSGPLCPVDLTLEDTEGFTGAYYSAKWPEHEGESTCLRTGTPYVHWSSKAYPEAIAAYVGSQRKYPGVDQWTGKWSIFVPYAGPARQAG